MKNRIIVYAGQYYDSETGLHYNYHRYYAPKLGRYLRADPIGLDGGINLYSYVQNNPINQVDLYGLWCSPWIKEFPLLGAFWWPTNEKTELGWRKAESWKMINHHPWTPQSLGLWVRWNYSYYQKYQQLIPVWRFCIEKDPCDESEYDYFIERDLQEGKTKWFEKINDTDIREFWKPSPEWDA